MNDPTQASVSGTAPTENERTWGMLAHLSALAGLVIPLIGNVLGPLVVSIARSDQSTFVAAHAKEALNFNISVTPDPIGVGGARLSTGRQRVGAAGGLDRPV